ncbi:MAG: hypothetical protein US53_C0007G0005 [Candidatus Woesebacteria bacterium GW2011_GWA1_37_7]|uniref:Uncharacterized protein n=1 Tax=Candidatus Woesebacteria bacterium GW2011_GWA1_37_7 TaxID=1618545 RepID=A0A0G0KB98_9BACT|nr:MAG: hypothetical protein US53_C0007G0005 [Candidatus Woesebacteria bacterium GW2011_GWA1_37_7]
MANENETLVMASRLIENYIIEGYHQSLARLLREKNGAGCGCLSCAREVALELTSFYDMRFPDAKAKISWSIDNRGNIQKFTLSNSLRRRNGPGLLGRI